MSVRTDELRRHPFSTQALDDDVSGAISFEELRDGLARLTSPPVRISFDDWEHMTRGFTVKKDGEDGEELLDQEGFHRLMRQVCMWVGLSLALVPGVKFAATALCCVVDGAERYSCKASAPQDLICGPKAVFRPSCALCSFYRAALCSFYRAATPDRSPDSLRRRSLPASWRTAKDTDCRKLADGPEMQRLENGLMSALMSLGHRAIAVRRCEG
jgi:hypothetical protein